MSSRFEGTHLSNTTPPYPMPPFTYKNNKELTITFETSPDVMTALVPEPLAVEESSITLYIGTFDIIEPVQISYREAGMLIPVSYGASKGSYMPILYLDKALPIIIGREVWGFPKFQADFVFRMEAQVIQVSVMKDGAMLIDATLHMAEPVAPEASPPGTIFLLKSIPSAEGNSRYDVKQLTTAVTRNGMRTEVRPGKATLRLGSTASDPLGTIPVLRVLSSVYAVSGFVLDYGKVVYNYLAEENLHRASS
jgi:acetoacetate decarboxylase